VREWRLRADLVVLSGCQTALGREHVGEGFIGLTYAFLQSGARNLLTSLWRVEDEPAALLMERFYANLVGRQTTAATTAAGTASLATALREAQQWLRRFTDEQGNHPFAHPAYWSGFVLSGTE